MDINAFYCQACQLMRLATYPHECIIRHGGRSRYALTWVRDYRIDASGKHITELEDMPCSCGAHVSNVCSNNMQGMKAYIKVNKCNVSDVAWIR